MADESRTLQLKRFETLDEALKYTGAEGELTAVIGTSADGGVNKFAFTLFLHDGKTQGGIPMNSQGSLFLKAKAAPGQAVLHLYELSFESKRALGLACNADTGGEHQLAYDFGYNTNFDTKQVTRDAMPCVNIWCLDPRTYPTQWAETIVSVYIDGHIELTVRGLDGKTTTKTIHEAVSAWTPAVATASSISLASEESSSPYMTTEELFAICKPVNFPDISEDEQQPQ